LKEELYDKFWYIIMRNTQANSIIKGGMKLCYSEHHEHRQDFDDYECYEQIIEYHFNVDKPCTANDTEVKSKQLNVKQNQVIESTEDSVDSTTCLGSEIDHQSHVEEANQFNNFGEVFRDI
jgi:hypothetical protein